MLLREEIGRSIKSALFELVAPMAVYAVMLGALAVWVLWGAVRYDDVFFDEVGPVSVFVSVGF